MKSALAQFRPGIASIALALSNSSSDGDSADVLGSVAQRHRKARAFLRGMVGEILLHATPKGLEGKLPGSLQGLLALSEQAHVSVTLVAGGGL